MDTGVKSSASATIYILLGIIALLLAGNAYLFLTRENAESSLVTIREEKAFLRNELTELKAELDQVNSLNLDLSAELKSRKAALREKIAELEKALNNNKLTARQLQEAKSEVAGLRGYVVAYMAEIGELKAQKDRLLAENKDLRSEVNVEKKRNKALASKNSRLNKKISEAALLEAEKVHIVTFESEIEEGKEFDHQTSRAGRVNKIRVEFTFYPNQVAEVGERELCFRLIDPEGKLLRSADSEGPASFTDAGGVEVPCSGGAVIQYDPTTLLYAIESRQETEMKKGDYLVQLFIGGRQIGEGDFSLK